MTLRDNACSVRVCEIILNLLDLFISVGVLPNKPIADLDPENSADRFFPEPPRSRASEATSDATRMDKDDELSVHHLFMDSTVR